MLELAGLIYVGKFIWSIVRPFLIAIILLLGMGITTALIALGVDSNTAAAIALVSVPFLIVSPLWLLARHYKAKEEREIADGKLAYYRDQAAQTAAEDARLQDAYKVFDRATGFRPAAKPMRHTEMRADRRDTLAVWN